MGVTQRSQTPRCAGKNGLMYTQCPECETTFKLSADDLRRAKGKVRCGECDQIFNALDYLADAVENDSDDLDELWISDSANNPDGDIESDLEKHEQRADAPGETPEPSNENNPDDQATAENSDERLPADEKFDAEFDEEDEGPILYTDPDEAVTATDEPEEDSLADTPDDDSENAADEVAEETEAGIWEQIPGVGAIGKKNAADDRLAASVENDDADTDAEEDNLEFEVPADKWTNFLGPLRKDQTATVWQPPVLSEENSDLDAEDGATDDIDNAGDNEEDEPAPTWYQAGYGGPTTPSTHYQWWLIGTALLAIALTTQLVHYNRDRLAAHTSYGNGIRSFYAVFEHELYPLWPITAYEIRASEAVAGESGTNILDIRTQIAATGQHAVGLPRLRIVLRDRWSNAIAARDFGSEEYAVEVELPASGLLQPGAILDAHVKIKDPGSGAQGFELELCLPRRNLGLECTGEPFK